MKLIDIILKEISLVKSQKIALLLIFLYPFLAIGLLGASFSGMSLSGGQNISVGIYNELSFESNIIDNIGGISNLTINQYYSEEELINGVKTKEILVGLKVSGASPNSQIRVDLFYDNSNLLSSRFFMEIAKAMVGRVTIEIAQERLGTIWNTMISFGKNIDEEIKNVEDFKEKLASAEIVLVDLEEKLKLVEYEEGDVEELRNSFNQFKTEYESLKEPLLKNKQNIKNLPTEIASAKSVLLVSISELETLRDTLSDENEKSVLNTQIQKLKQLDSQMDEWNSTAVQLSNLSDKIGDETSVMNENFAKVETLFDKATLGAQSISEVKDLIKNARESKIEIESKLDSSSILLSNFSTQLVEFGNIDPKVLAQPVVFYERTIFLIDSFGILVANATVIVLILTCMLLTSIIVILERTQNVSLRFTLSPTNKFTLFLGKIIGQLLIALVESVIIFAVAYFAFNIDLIPILPELIIATIIISISFISLGLLIAAFMKSQSTAILTSLLLVVPMLFLGGIILPLEFMEGSMQQISYFLPLTAANNILIGLIMKRFDFTLLIPEFLILTLISLIVFAIIMLKKEF